MKYQLINPVNKDYSGIEQVLTNRGIKYFDIPHYLHTTDEDVNSPLLLGEQLLKQAAAALINTIKDNKSAVITIDADADGYTSAAILANYLHDLFPTWVENNLHYFWHSGKQHGLSDCIDEYINKEYSLILIPDAGSNDIEECSRLKAAGAKIVVLDHHICDEVNESAIVINNQLSDYPNKDFCGAGVTWQFCRYLDSLLGTDYANNYLDLMSLGLIADMMSLQSLETKHLISRGLDMLLNPFIVYMAQKNSYSLGDKITPIGVAFYIAPFVNAVVRSGTQDEKQLLFYSMLKYKAFTFIPSTKRGHSFGETEKLVEQAIRTVANVKARQTQVQNASLEVLQKQIEQKNLLDNKVLLFLLEPGQVDKNVAGLIANKLMAKYQRPTCILTKVIDENGVVSYQGSARGCQKTGIRNFKDICEETEVIMYATGHQNAFGLGIEEDKVQTFLQLTDAALQGITDEAVYYVDYIFNQQNIDEDKVLDIAYMQNLWGKDVDEALIALEHVKVSPDMVTIYDKRTKTVKIHLSHLDAMIFFAKEKDVEILQTNNSGYVELNIVGKCNANEWMGNVTPQIFIQEYEVIDSNAYFF